MTDVDGQLFTSPGGESTDDDTGGKLFDIVASADHVYFRDFDDEKPRLKRTEPQGMWVPLLISNSE